MKLIVIGVPGVVSPLRGVTPLAAVLPLPANLSGLFSGFYPRTYLDTETWEPEKLKKWLENPRDVRRNATMQPVRLPPGDFDKLLGIIHTARPTGQASGGSFD